MSNDTIIGAAARGIYEADPVYGESGRAVSWDSEWLDILSPGRRERAIEEAQAALSALIEAGYVALPREPTAAMHAKPSELGSAMVPDPHERDQWNWYAIKAYRAMVSTFLEGKEPK